MGHYLIARANQISDIIVYWWS